tara:strand:- start:22477 stop:22647 length:171 start_codon:yes stop_codon:yes gene_type:complete
MSARIDDIMQAHSARAHTNAPPIDPENKHSNPEVTFMPARKSQNDFPPITFIRPSS